MNLEEAYENVKITDEEIKSIEAYLGYRSTAINILGALNQFNYYELINRGWSLPKNGDELKRYIDDFVNVYSVMYKESKSSRKPINLIRGTSNKLFNSLNREVEKFLSVSTKEEVAKTFCKYGDAALVHIKIEDGVPWIDAEKYRDYNSASEFEYIIAPFCRIDKKEYNSGNSDYKHYNLSLSKPDLEEKSKEELTELYEKVINGFSQNIENMKQYMELYGMQEELQERYKVAVESKNIEVLKDISKKVEGLYENAYDLNLSIKDYSSSLQSLLKGLCKQKELQIDKSMEIIEEDKRMKEIEKEAEERENARLQAINETSSKISHTPAKASKLESVIVDTYRKLLDTENQAKQIVNKLGISLSGTISNTTINQKIDQIKKNIEAIKHKCQTTSLDSESSIEEVTEISSTLTPLLDGVTYATELTRSFPDIVNSHKFQIDNDIKRSLYEKVHKVLQNSRIQKYSEEQEKISSEKVGFFGRLMGKDILKEEKLKNIRLKIRLAQTSTPVVQTKYSVQDMLAEIYASAISEFDGQFTPEMAEIFTAIRSTYGNRDLQPFSDEQISNLAMEKIKSKQKQMLPSVPEDGKRFFLKNKAKAQQLKLENRNLQIKIEQNVYSGNKWSTQNKGQDSILTFENHLKGIVSSTKEKQHSIEDLDKTLDLWKEDD